MNDYIDQIDDLLAEAEALPFGPVRLELVEQAVRLADLHDDPEEGYRTRHELLSAAYFAGRPEKTLVAFSWCLAQSDRDPEKFNENELLWEYRWVIDDLPSYLHIRREQIDEALADMTQRYRRAGLSLRPVHLLTQNVRMALGNRQAAQEAHRAMRSARRDWMSDALAEEQGFLVTYLVWMGQWQRAAAAAQPLLSGRLDRDFPLYDSYARLMVPLLRLGQVEHAASYYRKGWKALMRQPAQRRFSTMDFHVSFLALTGNLERAASLFEEYLPEALEQPEQSDRIDFFEAGWLLMHQLAIQGKKEIALTVPKTFPLYDQSGRYEPATLADWLMEQVRELGARFDARNGNDYNHRRLEAMPSLCKLATPFPLSSHHPG